ncbi:MAG: glycosyltransferase family 4 protein [Flavobacteriales bacterium]|nr:glycosyltransferase family 4 protein [Flavobacteriales bacterium]MCB9499665.1 glycosyltransferase family 4 protein [Erysipelotrichaceae bacterium]
MFTKQLKSSVLHITGHDHYLALGLRKKKSIVTIHDIEFIKRTNGFKKFILKKLWMDWPINCVDMVTTVSEFSKSEIMSLNNYKTPIHVIHNPLTLKLEKKEKKFDSECPNILHVGTKSNKNLPRLIEALNGITCQLTIIGKPTDELNRLLKSNNINHTFKSGLNNEEMIIEYEKCDLLAFVSTYEGFGLPIIEAQAVGRAVITSNTASMPEIASNSALLVSPFNVDEIRKGIVSLIDDEKLREHYIQLGFANVNRFKPNEIAKQYEKLYLSLINDK